MAVERIIFIVFVVVTFINQGVQFYIHFNAYPLLRYVGQAEFESYLNAYEARLTIPLLIPYAVTLLCNIALIFTRPEPLPVVIMIALLVLNLSVAMVTLFVATPVYKRIKASGQAGGDDMQRLMRLNLARLGFTTASSGIVILLLAGLLS